jgi:hypothetical protein
LDARRRVRSQKLVGRLLIATSAKLSGQKPSALTTDKASDLRGDLKQAAPMSQAELTICFKLHFSLKTAGAMVPIRFAQAHTPRGARATRYAGRSSSDASILNHSNVGDREKRDQRPQNAIALFERLPLEEPTISHSGGWLHGRFRSDLWWENRDGRWQFTSLVNALIGAWRTAAKGFIVLECSPLLVGRSSFRRSARAGAATRTTGPQM